MTKANGALTVDGVSTFTSLRYVQDDKGLFTSPRYVQDDKRALLS